MKRISILLLVLMTLTASAVTFADVNGTVTKQAPKENINLILNGVPLEFDTPPKIIDGRTLVPVRKLLESLGTEVSWIAAEEKIIAKDDNSSMEMWIGRKEILIDNTTYPIEVAPQIIDSRTYIPVRAAAELLDSSVHWDGETKTIIILNQELTKKAKNINTLFLSKGQLPKDLELMGTLEILNKGLSVLKGNINLDFEDSFINTDNLISNFKLKVDIAYTKGLETFNLKGDIATSEMSEINTLDINLLLNQNEQEIPVVYSIPIDQSAFNFQEMSGMEDSLNLMGYYLAPYISINILDSGDIEYIVSDNEPMINKMMQENSGEYENLDFFIKAYDNGGDNTLDKVTLHFEGDLPAKDPAFSEFKLSEDIEGTNTVLFSATIKLN